MTNMNDATPDRRSNRDFLNRVMDLDSHEMIPTHLWGEPFGPVAQEFVDLAQRRMADGAENSLVRPDVHGDEAAIDHETVWTVKGPGAPGAIDFARRLKVMDEQGVARQLVFPGFGQAGMFLNYNPGALEWFKTGRSEASLDRRDLARRVFKAHNAWAVRTTKALGSDRMRLVAFLDGETLPELMAQAEQVIEGGVRVVQIPVGSPPAGMSPADRRLDPFWRLCAEADVPVVVHIGSHQSLFASQAWNANVPEFEVTVGKTEEFGVEPYGAAVMQFGPDNMLCAMILGGVFERHPNLRFGAIELAAHWVGPLAEKLDMWVEQFKGPVRKLSMRPSEYLARNVRVTPFFFEPTERYIERNPELLNVFCYSTDYPHREGGKYSKDLYLKRLAGFGDDVLEKFFVKNGEHLLPA